MTRILGDTALVLALIFAAAGAYAAFYGGGRRRQRWVRLSEQATYVNFALLCIANLAMVYALVTHDFSISYVAQVGSRATPLFFSVISLWSSLEGSILFWGLVLAGYAAFALNLTRRRMGSGDQMVTYANGVMLAISAFFFMLLVGPAAPFELVSPVPADGPGPNPLLQNHILMAIHPPFLYLGYVGLSVPFAFAIGSLLAERRDNRWIELTRRWTLFAWLCLSLAIMFGMWWSYEVLGWGGYWAWDPVENASFLPWLTATAFLHSVLVEQRRGMLKTWNMSLVIATFLLTVLGTFLTRSGILSSVHAFAGGDIGFYFLGFIGVTLAVSVSILAVKGPKDEAARLDSAVSRETVFLLNNLVLTAFTFTVLLGTLFPLVAEAVRGVQVSVGAPFFNQMTLPLMMALLFLLGVGPALPWGEARLDVVRKKMLAPGIGLVVALGIALAFGTTNLYALAAFSFAGFALVTNLQEFWRPTRVRIATHGENPLTALGRVIRANRHRYGGYIAHIGVIVMAVGIAASSVFRYETEATLRPGESMQVKGYELTLERLWAEEEPHRFVVGADMALSKGGRALGTLDPRLNFYTARGDEPLPTPAVRSRLVDVYVNLMAFERDGSSATISALIEPLVAWIWLGGMVIGLGGGVAIWPDRRRNAPPRSALHTAEPREEREPAVVGGD